MPASCLRLCKFLRKRRLDRDACLASLLHLHRLSRQEPVKGRLVLFAVQWTLVGAHGYPVHDTGVFPCRMLGSEMHGLSDTHYKIKETLLIRDLQPSLNEKTLPFLICILFSFIRHFHISHNAPYLPPRVLYKHCYPGENTKVMQNFERQIRCIMGNVEVAYLQIFYFMFSYVSLISYLFHI